MLLAPEYAAWAASPDNHLRDRVAVRDGGGLHLVSPIAGSTFLLDPDVPTSGLVPLVAQGGSGLVWESPTLTFRDRAGAPYAVAVEGQHNLTVRDPATGKKLTTWIRVKAL